MKNHLITGGCGFIGTNFIRHALAVRPDWSIINLDALTYAGNPENLENLILILLKDIALSGGTYVMQSSLTASFWNMTSMA